MRGLAVLLFAATCLVATSPALAQTEVSQAVENGGIMADGWMGQVDASEAANGLSVDSASLMKHGDMLHASTGPAIVYWHKDNHAHGSYTVSATFTEPEYMNRNNHPHPYGIFVGGNDLGSDTASYLYCAAYGNGNFIVRGFSPAAFQLNGRRGEANDAVNKAEGQGKPVTQQIAVSVTAESVSCSINGTVVGTYPKTDAVGEGKIKSTDGFYGIRFGHNTEAQVAGLKMEQH